MGLAPRTTWRLFSMLLHGTMPSLCVLRIRASLCVDVCVFTIQAKPFAFAWCEISARRGFCTQHIKRLLVSAFPSPPFFIPSGFQDAVCMCGCNAHILFEGSLVFKRLKPRKCLFYPTSTSITTKNLLSGPSLRLHFILWKNKISLCMKHDPSFT